MDSVNEKVLREMQEYAQMYFDAIVEANTTEGEGCGLAPGRYSAKELANREKCPMGNYYALPLDEIYEEEVEMTAGSFGMRFPYRRIFVILAQWEAMCRPGKFKTVFEVGAVEEKTAKVLTRDRTALGAFVAKRMRLRRIGGNWWAAPKEIRKEGQITGYYELNGVMFAPGKQFWGKIANSANQSFIANWDDAAMTKLITAFFSHEEAAKERRDYEYFREVATRVGIATNDTGERKPAATPTETPRISTETAEADNYAPEDENAADAKETAKYRRIDIYAYMRREGGELVAYRDMPEADDFSRRGLMAAVYRSPGRGYVCAFLWYNVAGEIYRDERKNYRRLSSAMEYMLFTEGDLAVNQPNAYEAERLAADRGREARLVNAATGRPLYGRTAIPTKTMPKPRCGLRKWALKLPVGAVGRRRVAGPRNCKNPLVVAGVPRCSTAHHSRRAGKMVATPPGYAPPIRGDCKLSASA